MGIYLEAAAGTIGRRCWRDHAGFRLARRNFKSHRQFLGAHELADARRNNSGSGPVAFAHARSLTTLNPRVGFGRPEDE